jgi:hypothetical protein
MFGCGILVCYCLGIDELKMGVCLGNGFSSFLLISVSGMHFVSLWLSPPDSVINRPLVQWVS